MKRVLMSLSVLALIVSSVGCGVTTINPGYVGIVVNKTGTNRGVDTKYELTTGRVWYNPVTSDVVEYPTFVQSAVWTANKSEGHPQDESITFTTKDSMIVNADFNVAYSLKQDLVPAFYVKFRSDDLTTFTDGYLHNQARECINDVAGQYDVEQIMGDNAKFLTDSRTCLQQAVQSIGVHIEQFGLIGAPRPPEQVMQAINLKVQATQIALQKQNEIVQAEADAKKRVAEAEGQAKAILVSADAQAQANRKIAESLSDTLIKYNAVQRWDGHRPTVEGGNGGTLLTLPLNQK